MNIRFSFSFGVVVSSCALLLLGSSSCTHAVTSAENPVDQPSALMATERHPAASGRIATLPDQQAWQSLYTFADNLDLNAPGTSISLHGGGGTSVYGVVNVGGKTVGALLVENSGASVTGETIAFTLARALGIVSPNDFANIQPGVYKNLTGANLTTFMTIVPTSPILITDKFHPSGYAPAPKNLNRVTILARYAKDSSHMDAVFKRWDAKPEDFVAVVGAGETLNASYTLPGSSAPLASLISCDGPRADGGRAVKLNGGPTTELQAARELSNILLIDALTSQWDRFSGGNLQTVNKGGQAHFVAFDNGGTWNAVATVKNLRLVSRFDRGVADRILALSDYFDRGTPFMGLRTDAEVMSALDIAQAPKAFAKLKANVAMTAAHIRAHNGCYF